MASTKMEEAPSASGRGTKRKMAEEVEEGSWHMSKVEKVETDDKGLVRTAWVLMRPRDSREKSLPYRSKKLISMKVGIQRLVLICPAEMVEEELGVDPGVGSGEFQSP